MSMPMTIKTKIMLTMITMTTLLHRFTQSECKNKSMCVTNQQCVSVVDSGLLRCGGVKLYFWLKSLKLGRERKYILLVDVPRCSLDPSM